MKKNLHLTVGLFIYVGLLAVTFLGDPWDYLDCKFSPMSCSEGETPTFIVLGSLLLISAYLIAEPVSAKIKLNKLTTAVILSIPMYYLFVWMNFFINFGR